MLTLPELKSTLNKYGITPKKFLGQNFLVDSDVVEDIMTVCRFTNIDWVMEIGAGLGALTNRLARDVKRVLAIEKDRSVCLALNDIMKGFSNVRIVCDDFLEMDLESALVEAPFKVKAIGNLPYYITTPIIERLIENRNNFESVFIMVQKEVADRICAKPGGKDYGSLSVYAQFYTKPSILLDINRHSFYPKPEVDSTFLELSLLAKPSVQVKDQSKFFAVVKAGFGQRRKTLLNSLLSGGEITLDKPGLAALLESIGIDPGIRAERLTLQQFATIADALWPADV
ncbi:MAG TPA: 16S rRNA (adenine(1518)-N(6)/adenine(1519)-N(6))-dimethyltransferase RsmA [Candidatus Omnitrophota bacterium]|nr:16S rRNA (adenine(1518)-N(6)/adenine(1519)-N(6))-dimethyltransferase RsmA [Candidatus Omnitrophota bacterium]HPN66818.1 16S rRNA (adenine(1518)-N(6)/adenine(1519)-N(6))-dimethyltransferase RsmA [Candidatus Omnitrophota bacterium]